MKKSSRKRPTSWERNLLTLAVASCFATDVAIAAGPVLPNGPTVINGQVFFNYNGNLLQITNTPGAVINWQGFSIGASEITRFIQQSASSAVLNRVTAGNPSVILGALQSQLANGATGGRVYLINPSGVVFGAGAQVNTGGLVVSTLGLSDADFASGRNRFTEIPGAGGIVNQGKITTPTGGNIYLVAPNIVNSGIIRSDGGEIILAAGKSVDIVSSNSPDLRVTITAPDNQVVNLGQIIAQGGKIGIYGGLIRQAGVVNANTAVRGENGKIVFKATKDVTLEAGSTTTASGPTAGSISIQSDAGKVVVGGAVEANATQGKGGTITVAAQQGVSVEATGTIAANGVEGGTVALSSTSGSVAIAGTVSANAARGRAGDVTLTAATNTSLASTAQVSASGGLGSGSVSIKAGKSVALDAGSRVVATGAVGGTVTVQSEQSTVIVQGTIDATATDGAGGTVEIAAASDITLDDSSRILVSGLSGGTVKVQSGDGTLLASGLIDGQGNEGPGGLVWLLAPRVGLVRQSVVNASGRTGGGTVLVGGDYHGDNPDVQNAWRTYVGADAVISADALTSGNGGKVVVWADDITRFYGFISSRGGPQSGNGGFVETSGRNFLDYGGNVNLTAPHGVLGTLLLDPTEITIRVAGADNNINVAGTGPFTDTSSGGGSVLTTTTINTQLGTANVTVTTSSNDIVISNAGGAVTLGPGAANGSTLTLNSAGNISWNAAWTYDNNGQLNLYSSGGTIAGVGALTVAGSSPVLMQALSGIGTAGLNVLTTGLGSFAATTATGGIFVSNSGSGNVDVTSLTNPITTLAVNGLSTTAATATDIKLANSAGSITVSQPISTFADTSTGNITLQTTPGAGNIIINANVATGNASRVDGGGNQTPTSGDITVTSGGNITGSGQFITGSAALTGAGAAGTDSASSGNISLTAAGGTIGLSDSNALQIGTAQRTGGGAGTDTANSGNIVLSSSGEINNGTASTPLGFTIGTASGALTNNQATLQATTTGGAAGKIFVTSTSAFNSGAITTSGGDVNIATTGAGALLTATANIDTTNGGGTPGGASITLTADDMDFSALAANSIKAGTGANTVILKPNAANRTINITGGSTGQLDLSLTELQTVSVAGGTLQIGSTGATGDINLNVTLTNGSVNAATLRLVSGHDVNITGGQDIGAIGTEFNHHVELKAGNNVSITNGNVYLADNKNLTIVGDNDSSGAGSVNIGGDTVKLGTTGTNTGSMSIAAQDIGMTLSGGGTGALTVLGSGAQTFTAKNQILFDNTTGGTLAVSTGSGVQSFDTSAATGSGNVIIQGSPSGAGTGSVLISTGSGGSQNFNLKGGLTVQSLAGSNATASTAVSADSGQTIVAKYVEVIGQGAALATINNDTTTGNASIQSITANGANGSGESVVLKAPGTGGATLQNGIAASTGQQNILINGSGANLLRVTGTASDARILANGTGVAGNQQNITVNTGTSNAIEIGDVAAGATAGISGIIGRNQTVVADTLTIRGGTGVTKHSQLVNNAGAQNVTLAGTLTLVGGTAVGAVTGCAPGNGGSCAFVSNNGAGLQHITANKLDLKGGDIGGATGIHNTAGIFVNSGNMQLDVGAAGLIMLGGDGDPTPVTGGDNGATIGGSGANGRTLTLNIAGNTTFTGGTTEGSSAFIGLAGSGSGQSVTVTFTGTTGDVTLNGGSNLNAGAAIGAGRQQDNATSDVTVTGKNITLNPGSVGVARIGHSALAVNGGGNVSVTATGGDINLSNGAGAASYILTTGNVTLQASSAGKVINEQSGGYVGANSLTAIADSGITLTGTNNAVSSFSATNNSANAISLKNTIALDVAAGNISNAARNVTLDNTGAVTDTGAIVAGGLELLGSGPYTLDSAANTVTTLAANITGAGNSLTYVNAGSLTVGTVNTTGITTAANVSGDSGSVTLSTVAGNILVSQAITTGAATVATTGAATVNSGAISLTAGGNGNLIGTATVTTGAATVNGGVAGDSATSGDITLAGNRVAQAAAGATPFSVVFGAANAGGGTSNQGRLNAATDGVGAAGDIRITSGTPLSTNAITSADPGALISIATTGGNNLTNVGTISGPGGITLDAGAGTFDNSGGTLTTSNTNNAISITANDWILGTGANKISTGASGGAINIDRTAGAQISLGTALTSTELATVTTSGNFTIGSATNGGGVDVAANVTFAGTTPTVKLLSGLGAITNAGGANAIIATNLDLTAKTGVGSAGNAIKTTVGGNLSATNTTAGDIYLATTAGVTLGGGSAVIDEQVLNGTISVAAGGAIGIAGNMSVSGGGNSQILLNATGNITRSGGTVTARDITLTANTAGSGIGTSGAPVFTAASGTLTLTAGTGGAFVNNTGSVTLATPTLGVDAPITVTSTGSLTLPAFAFNTGAGSMDFESNGGTLTTVAALTTTTGNITLVGSSGIALGHDLTTAGGNIQLTGPTTLAGTHLLTSAGGGITFNGALAGAGNNLTVNAGATGNVGFSGAVDNVPLLTIANANNTTFSNSLGAGAAGAVTIANSAGTVDFQGSTHITTLTMAAQPYNITFTGGANTLDTATTFVNTGNVTLVSGANTTTFTLGVDTSSGPAVTSIGGTLNTTGGTQIKLGPTTLTAAATLNAGAGNVTFNGTVNGGQTLAVNSTGTTLFSGIVGGGTALTSVTTNAGGTTAINGGAVTTTGAQTYNDAVTLGAGTTLNGVNVSFNNTLNGGQTLTVNDSGTTTFGGIVGGGTALTSVTTNAAGTTAINGGAIATTGAQTYNDAVTLGTATTLASTGAGAINFANTVNGAQVLTVNTAGTTIFGGLVGGGTALTSVTTDAGGTTQVNGGGVSTSGTQTYNDSLQLGANAVFTGSTGTFNGAINGAAHDLTLNFSGLTTVDGTTFINVANFATGNGGTTQLSGVITTSGAQTYNDVVTLGLGTTLNGVNVSFNNTLNGGQTLTVNDSGTTTFGGIVGGGAALTSITTNAGGTTAINGGAITTTGAQTYNDAVTLGTATTLASTGAGAINFANTVNGAQVLTVNTAGTTIFGGLVGGGTALTSVTTDAGGTTQVNGGGVSTSGTQTYNDSLQLGANAVFTGSTGTFNGAINGAAHDLTLNFSGLTTVDGTTFINVANFATGNGGTTQLSGVITTSGAQTYNDVVTLGLGTTLNGVNVSFNNTLNGGQTLTVNDSGTTTFGGIVGGGAALTSITTNAGGTTAINGGAITTTGSQTYNDAVTLGAGTTLNGVNVNFASSLDSTGASRTLVVNDSGTTTFGGAVGGGLALTSLATNAAGTTAINGGAITTTGAQTYNDAVTLGAGTTLNGVNVSFNNTLNGGQALTVNDNGTTTFGGVVGGGVALTSITTNAGGTTALNGGAITTTGSQTYNDAVTLGAGTTLNGVNVNFASSLDSAGASRTLVVNNSGTTTFGGAVGSGLALTSIATNAAGTTAINGGAITTTGAQTYNDAVTLGAGTTLNGVNVSLNNTLNGNQTLTVNDSGTTTFGGIVGGGAALTSITTNAGGTTAINGGAITTTGAQTYNDAVTLGAGTTLNGVNISFNTTLNGGQALTVNDGGTTTFGGIVGGGAALTSVTTNAAGTTAINGGAITTTGAQTYNNAVTLGAGTTLSGVNVAFNNTLNGGQALTVNDGGATTFGGVVGGSTALTSITTNAGGTTAINGGAVTTIGGQTYNDAVTLGAATSLNGVNVSFNNTLNGGQTLTVNDSGTTAFGGIVGGGTALTSITTDPAGTTAINTAAITTTGAQTYNDAVTLGAGTTLNGVNVSFNTTLNGGQALTVNDGGTTSFVGVVGGGAALTSITTNAAGATAINSGTITTSGAQTYNDAVTLGAATTLNGVNVAFNGTLNGGHTLTVNDSGTTTFGGMVGGGTALTSITTNVGGTTTLSGGAITTTGAQTYNDAVTLGAGTTLNGVNVSFNSTLNGGQALTVNDSGSTIFGGIVGGGAPLASITTDAAGTTAMSTAAITTTGAQTYNDTVNLGTGATLTSTGGGAIFFAGTVDGATSLAVNTAGATTFIGAVGNTTPLTTLTTNAGGTTQINGGSVTTTGDQNYGDATTVGVATTFHATNPAAKIAFNSSLTANANALTITADEIDFNGGVNSVSGTGTIQLQPNNPNAAIWLGTAADAGPHANELDLTTADSAALSAGFTGSALTRPVTVGQNAGTHTITIGTATFNDSVLIQAPAGAGSIQWYLAGGTPILSAPNIDFNVPGQISGGGIVNAAPAGSLKIIQSGGIGAPGAPLVTHVSNLEAANSGSGDVYIQNDRDITLVNQFVNNVANKVLWLETTNGSINTLSAVVSVAGGAASQIVLSASDAGVAGGANINVGPLGISSNGGKIVLHAADNINVNGTLNSNNGNIEIIAGARGNAGGTSTWIPGLLNGPLILPATEEALDSEGKITLNALINAGAVPATAGNVVLIAASRWDGTFSTSLTNDSIVQTTAGAIRANDLTAVTLRGLGGPFFGGGAIRLNVAAAPLNATTNVNLFACAVVGCPDSTPTRSGAPFVTAPMINEIARPPLGTYGDGPLFYTSSSTNISGVGTVNDFITYTAGNYSLSGSTMFGRNLTFEGDGDVDINLATLIDNTQISNGGTVKFIAGGNIRYNPFTAGATFGSAASPLSNRNLEFYAAGNIDLNNGIFIGPTGNLVANANTGVTFITPSPPSPFGQSLPASGTGDVTLRGNHEIFVGDNFTLNARNLNILGGDLGSPNQQQLGERLNVGGTVTINLTGNLNLTGGTATAASASAALINAGNVALDGGMQNITLAAGSDGGLNKPADARIVASGNVSVATPGNVTLDALTGGANSSATISGGTVSIGSAGAPVNSIVLKGGTSLVTGATPQVLHADAIITANGGLSAYVGGGGLTMTGGSATVMASAGTSAQATAAVGLKGGSVVLNVGNLGDVVMTGGTSLAQTGLSASKSDLSADASASIVSGASFSPTIAGSLTMQGGTATAGPASAHASSATLIDGGFDLTLDVGTGLTLTAGTALANGGAGNCASGGGACTNVSALLSSKSKKTISVATGDVNFTGGSATANGPSTSSTAFAGTDSGSVAGTLATLLTLDAMTGRITLSGGPQSGTGGLNSDAAVLSVGGIRLFGHGNGIYSGLTLNGQFGSGLFQNLLNSGRLLRLDGRIPPVRVEGGVTICPAGGAACAPGSTYGNSFLLSGSPPSNLDPLLSGLISSIEMSKPNRIAGFLDDVNQGSRRVSDKNYCK